MSMWRKTVVATAIVGAGLAATTGSAFAGEDGHSGSSTSSNEGHGDDKGRDGGHDDKGRDGHDDGGRHDGDERDGDGCANDVSTEDEGDTEQSGLVNVSDTDTIIPTNLCHNDVPVNVLGVQVPIQDLGLNLPILSPSDDGGGNSAESG